MNSNYILFEQLVNLKIFLHHPDIIHHSYRILLFEGLYTFRAIKEACTILKSSNVEIALTWNEGEIMYDVLTYTQKSFIINENIISDDETRELCLVVDFILQLFCLNNEIYAKTRGYVSISPNVKKDLKYNIVNEMKSIDSKLMRQKINHKIFKYLN